MRMMAKVFAREDVADVHLDHRHLHRRDCIANRDRGVSIAAGVEHDAGSFLCPGLMDPIDQLPFVVRLPEFEVELVLLGAVAAEPFHVLQRRAAIGLRLARAEQIKVGTVEDVNGFRHEPNAATSDVSLIGAPYAKGKLAALRLQTALRFSTTSRWP